jgi:hypothetical protein
MPALSFASARQASHVAGQQLTMADDIVVSQQVAVAQPNR